MLRRAQLLGAAAAAAVLALAACGDDGGADARDPLADRVVAVLEAGGDSIDGELDGADVSCPTVEDPDPGDRATCVLEFAGDRRVEVDVEFQEDGSLEVVAVVG